MSFSVKCEQTGLEYCPRRRVRSSPSAGTCSGPTSGGCSGTPSASAGRCPRSSRGAATGPPSGNTSGKGGIRPPSSRVPDPHGSGDLVRRPGPVPGRPRLLILRPLLRQPPVSRVRGAARLARHRGGSRGYLEPLTATFATGSRRTQPSASIRRREDGVDVLLAPGEPLSFDQVWWRRTGDQALALLSDPGEAERAILGAIPYQENRTLAAHDVSLLPKRRRCGPHGTSTGSRGGPGGRPSRTT